MTVYISGPISGKRAWNRRAFEKAQEKLEKEFSYLQDGQFRITNPQDIKKSVDDNFSELNKFLGSPKKPQWGDYMKVCIKRLVDATHVLLLKGWENSRGALLEKQIAEALGIPCAETIEELKKSGGIESWK